MSKLFSALKSAIFVEEETVQASPQPTAPSPQPRPYSIPSQPVAPAGAPEQTSTPPQLNTKLLDKLCGRLEEENLPGVDYYELKTAVSKPETVQIVPQEESRILMAYNMLKVTTPSLTKKTIIASIDHYTGLLHTWEREALEDIESKRNEVATQIHRIEEIKAQIEKLNQEAAALSLEVDATQSACKINENDMRAAVSFLVSKLQDDKQKIDRIISE